MSSVRFSFPLALGSYAPDGVDALWGTDRRVDVEDAVVLLLSDDEPHVVEILFTQTDSAGEERERYAFSLRSGDVVRAADLVRAFLLGHGYCEAQRENEEDTIDDDDGE